MLPEQFRNPFKKPASVTIYRDAPLAGPCALKWCAMIADEAGGFCGFNIRDKSGLNQFYTDTLGDMVLALCATGYPIDSIYRSYLPRTEGKAGGYRVKF